MRTFPGLVLNKSIGIWPCYRPWSACPCLSSLMGHFPIFPSTYIIKYLGLFILKDGYLLCSLLLSIYFMYTASPSCHNNTLLHLISFICQTYPHLIVIINTFMSIVISVIRHNFLFGTINHMLSVLF